MGSLICVTVDCIPNLIYGQIRYDDFANLLIYTLRFGMDQEILL